MDDPSDYDADHDEHPHPAQQLSAAGNEPTEEVHEQIGIPHRNADTRMAALEQQLVQLQAAFAQQEIRNEESMQHLKQENARLSDIVSTHEQTLAIVGDIAEKNRLNLWKRERDENRRRFYAPCKVKII